MYIRSLVLVNGWIYLSPSQDKGESDKDAHFQLYFLSSLQNLQMYKTCLEPNKE